MSEEQLKAFWEAIQSDLALQEKPQGVTDPGTIVDIAKEAGFTISAEELQAAQETLELSDEQLICREGDARDAAFANTLRGRSLAAREMGRCDHARGPVACNPLGDGLAAVMACNSLLLIIEPSMIRKV